MPQIVEIQGVGEVEFPDSMSGADIEAAIQKNILPQIKNMPAAETPANPDVKAIKESDMAGIVGFNTSMGRFAHGILQPITENLLGDKVKQSSKQVAQNREQLFKDALEADPTGAKLGELTGYIGQAAITPGGVTGGLLRRAITGGAAGAGLGASQYVPEEGSRGLNAAIGLAGGAVGAPLLSGLMSKNPFVKAGTGGLLGAGAGYGMSDDVYGTGAGAVVGAAAPFVPGMAIRSLSTAGRKLLNKLTGNADDVVTFYHGTTPDLKNKVLKEGLQPSKNVDTLATDKGYADFWSRYTQSRTGADFENVPSSMVKVTIPKSQLDKYVNRGDRVKNDAGEYLYNYSLKQPIPAKYISSNLDAAPAAAATSPRTPLDDVAAMNVLRGVDEKAAAKTLKSARRLGVDITPAEAGGSPIAAQTQGQLGTSKQGTQALYEFGKKRLGQEKQAVAGMLDELSPNNASAAVEVRRATQKVISKEEKALQETARPFYEQSASDLIPKKEFGGLSKSNIFQHYLQKVKGDPLLADDIAKYPDNSVKVLDYVKKYMDDDIGRLIREEGVRSNKAALLTNQKNKMLEMLDKHSDNYKTARTIYSVDGAGVRQLKESNIGRIADLSDVQLKNVSKIIFDPAQTDIKVMNQMREKIQKENPGAWSRLIRNEMERRLDKAGDYAGSTLYNKVLKSDRDFNQFLAATKGMPGVRRKLIDMKRAFKDLIEPVSTKTAARTSKLYFDAPARGSNIEAAIGYVKDAVKGKYDQAAIKMITNNQWDKEFNALMRIQNKDLRTQKLISLFTKVGAIEAAQTTNEALSDK